ncbi:MAG TPA: hypothetical protein VKX17_04275 [Planctomycetota bacterium]|nr:hypothetical protein [Planctomycetota bacterium]
MKTLLIVAIMLRAALALCGEEHSPAQLPEKTTISATLDVPHQKGQNLIWCNTLQLAWNAMGKDFCGEALRLEGTPAIEKSMNASTVSKADVDAESALVKVGEVNQAFLDALNGELKKRFGDDAPPPLKMEIHPDAPDVLAYAYLFKNLAFATPLDKQKEALAWRGDEGANAPLQAFGLIKVGGANAGAAKQIQIVNDKHGEYIIELKTKSDADHIILAQVTPGATLKDTLDAVRKKVVKPDRAPFAIQVSDQCLMPCVGIDVTRVYNEIIGKNILNAKLANGYFISDARQDIRFKLDEKGAVLKSEAQIVASKNGHAARNILFNRPFLLYIERARAVNPYLAIWFENPNLFIKSTAQPAAEAPQPKQSKF